MSTNQQRRTSSLGTDISESPSGDREPLLLIHGIGGSAAAWDGVVPRLMDRHKLIVPTLLGHHGGPAIPGGVIPTIAVLADQLERDLDDSGASRAHIAGNSLGGLLALELAGRGRALSVVAISPGGGWRERSLYRRFMVSNLVGSSRLMKSLGPRVAPHMGKAWVRAAVMGSAVAHPRRVPAGAARDFIDSLADCPAFVPAVESIDHHPFPEIGDTPVRLAWGTRDFLTPPRLNADWFEENLPDAESIRVPDVGHQAMYDDPEGIARLILEVTARQS